MRATEGKVTRIYYVSAQPYIAKVHEGTEWLVEATSSAQAIRHVTKPYVARVAEQGDLVRLIQAGVKVEKASAE